MNRKLRSIGIKNEKKGNSGMAKVKKGKKFRNTRALSKSVISMEEFIFW